MTMPAHEHVDEEVREARLLHGADLAVGILLGHGLHVASGVTAI